MSVSFEEREGRTLGHFGGVVWVVGGRWVVRGVDVPERLDENVVGAGSTPSLLA